MKRWWYVIVMCSASSLYCSQGPQGQQAGVIAQLQAAGQRFQVNPETGDREKLEEGAERSPVPTDHEIQPEAGESETDWFEAYYKQNPTWKAGDWKEREDKARQYLQILQAQDPEVVERLIAETRWKNFLKHEVGQ